MFMYMYILYIYIYPEVHITRCEEVDGGDGLEPRGRRVAGLVHCETLGWLFKGNPES